MTYEVAVSPTGLKYGIDVSEETFGAKVTIAHLAVFSFFHLDSDTLDIYTAQRISNRDWKWELEDWDYEYLTSHGMVFKDGSKLFVSAWADDPADRFDDRREAA
jgi:hypothetical protein